MAKVSTKVFVREDAKVVAADITGALITVDGGWSAQIA